MKKIVCAIALLALVLSSPVLAQGPFTDVPTDHWAYDAVDQLVKDGIIVGYPDGTFGGKRAMTRYEFAQAIARMIPVIAEKVTPPAAGQGGVSQSDFDALTDRVKALEARPVPEVTKADLDAIRKMVDEFKDELTAIGVDVDALKKDVADLSKRVTALEIEQDRVKIHGTVNVFGVFDKARDSSSPVDRDERDLFKEDKLLEDISLVKELDLSIDGRVSKDVKAHALLNAGDYLEYVETVDDYVGGNRPVAVGDSGAAGSGLGTIVFPYYVYLDWAMGNGTLTVGRFPIGWTPYTLKMIDVDSYTVNQKTDTGEYPLDGIRGMWKFGGVGLQLFAAKSDQNAFLSSNGLTSQATAGLYNEFAVFNSATGSSVGGLDFVDQLAGARVTFGVSSANVGLSYIECGGNGSDGVSTFDTAKVWGADLNAEFGKLMVGAEWAQTTTVATGAGTDVDNDNTALDANLGMGFGALGVKGGWKSIGSNFAAPGFWDKMGRWTNPTNVEGPYVDVKWGLGSSLNLVLGAEFLSAKDDNAALPGVVNDQNDNINYYTAGLKWGMSPSSSVDLGLEWVRWDPSGAGSDVSDEKYITIGFGHQFGPNVMARVGYQIIDFNASGLVTPYPTDYKGDLAVAQFMVKF